MRFALAVFATLALAGAAPAQERLPLGGPPPGGPPDPLLMLSVEDGIELSVVKGQPYQAEAVTEIVQRLAEHETKTVPVIEKYSQLHGVVKVDGIGSFEEVFERTSSVLESLFRAG